MFEKWQPSCQKAVSPKRSSYSEEYITDDFGVRMMNLLHYTGLKLTDFKKAFGIKDATTKHIPGDYIQNVHDME